MKEQAIVLGRISSKDQLSGHSLEAQLSNAKAKAEELNLEITKTWSGVLSSNKGKNLYRKDLEEMLVFCKKNRKVKYLLVDMVNRFMREMKVMIYYIVKFEELGVKLVFCDPSQQHLNNDDQMSQLLVAIEAFKAEADNKARMDTSMSRMKSRISEGYYLSHPHQGYIKSETPGLHIPDPIRFEPLKRTCKRIIYEGMTIPQAVKLLNDEGYQTKGGRKMDTEHFVRLFSDEYYCGVINIDKKDWPKGVAGLHQPMLSKREHGLLVSIFKKRNPRLRAIHNPEFPLANIIRHNECVGEGGYEKFSGHWHNRGKRNGKQRPLNAVYDCRDCRKRIARNKVHQSISGHLENLKLLPSREKFTKALLKVWRMQRGSNIQVVKALNIKRDKLIEKIKLLTNSLVTESDETIKENIRNLIKEANKELNDIDTRITEVENKDLESEEFVDFAIKFMSDIKENWWKLDFNNKKRGEQILFNGNLQVDNHAKVHTPNLNTIFTLGTNKKALSDKDNALLVELTGYCPPCPSVELLGDYKLSLFRNFFRATGLNRQNTATLQPCKLDYLLKMSVDSASDNIRPADFYLSQRADRSLTN